MPNLSLEEMKKVIDGGGSVLLPPGDDGEGRRLATRHDHLPTEADLARGDAAKEAAARQALDDQIRSLQSVRDSLGAAPRANAPAPALDAPALDPKAPPRGK